MPNLEGQRDFTETQVLGGDEAGQEDVDTLTHAERQGDNTIRSWHTIQAADVVRQIIQHAQIVLDHNHEAIFNLISELKNNF